MAGAQRTDLSGQQFSRLTVLEYAGKSANGRNALWKCVCSCGTITMADTRQLKEGKKRDCGCMQGIRDDLTGKQFGSLICQYPVKKDGHKHIFWKCSCICGKGDCKGEIEVEGRRLKTGTAKDCSYDPTSPKTIRVDYTGRRFGLLTVLYPTGKKNASNNSIYRCQCDCGGVIDLATSQLISGNNRSCGCLRLKQRVSVG